MKKIFIISILFVTAFLFFTGCGDSPARGGTGAPSIAGRADVTPLFPESEATIQINSLEYTDLSDGSWEFKFILMTYDAISNAYIYLTSNDSVCCNLTSWTLVDSKVFTMSGGNPTITSGTDTNAYTMDDSNKGILNTFASDHGQTLTWDGNTVTITLNRMTPTWLESMYTFAGFDTFTAKKNADETRFIVKLNSSTTSEPYIFYLKKLD
ncbi:MAG: hypothetical protein J5747_02175 [Spirochaetaceae bacterium]|nr:hypothetical protein [Spirochaetaceae bacterium]